MGYRDEKKLEHAIKSILEADEKSVENISDDIVRQEVKKIRAME